jgi:ABC-type multidrug transport system ATPase subunit
MTASNAVRCVRRVGDAPALLQVEDLTKRYGDQTALADIAFSVARGEVVGLIGPNGAGKTTLLETIAGLLSVDAGVIRWRGEELPTSRRREAIFYVPDGVRPYRDQYVSRRNQRARRACG